MTAPGPISYADRAPSRIAPSDCASKSSEGERRASPTSSDAYGETAYPIHTSSCVALTPAGALLPFVGSRLSRTTARSEEHTSELQSQSNLVCRLLLEKKKKTRHRTEIQYVTTHANYIHSVTEQTPITNVL